MTKSLQQYVRKGVRELFTIEFTEDTELGREMGTKKQGATQMVIKTKELLENQFVSVWK